MKQLSEQEALHRCASYCSSAERCITDIRKKLEQWEIPLPSQNNIIHRLQKERFLDEARYCLFFVNDKSKFAKWGKNKILYTLRQKHIPEEHIQNAIRSIEPADNLDRLQKLLQQKAPSVKAENIFEKRMKLLRFAAGRGFDIPDINSCLDKLKI